MSDKQYTYGHCQNKNGCLSYSHAGRCSYPDCDRREVMPTTETRTTADIVDDHFAQRAADKAWVDEAMRLADYAALCHRSRGDIEYGKALDVLRQHLEDRPC